jgi:hypothetical protein
VYDIDLKKWTDLGEADIHPDRDWDYIKASWNPWFADGSRLAYFTHDHSILSISAPDGKQRKDIQINGTAGIASPSPDGQFIAYVRLRYIRIAPAESAPRPTVLGRNASGLSHSGAKWNRVR